MKTLKVAEVNKSMRISLNICSSCSQIGKIADSPLLVVYIPGRKTG